VERSGARAPWRGLADTFAGRCLGALVRAQVLDRGMALAAQAFTALIPLLILVGSLAPAGREEVPEALIRRFGLDASAADAVRAVFSAPGGTGIGALSVVVLVASGVSFTRRLQRTYEQAWDLPPGRSGLRNSANALLGLTALLAEVVLLSVARALVAGMPSGWILGAPLSAAAALVLWTSVPWLLLGRRLPWRRLLPTGALAAACTAVYGVATGIYMPRLFASYSLRYGLFGVTLAIVGWLLCIALIVVCTAVVAAEFDRAPERWAGRLRAGLGGASRPAPGAPADEVMRSG
jgi:membrane protein